MEDILYETFYEVERKHWWCVARRELVYALTRQLVPAGGKLLDVGCGTGFFLEKAQADYEAYGLDQSELAVSMCRDRGLNNVHLGSATDLSAVSDERFDAILLLDVLEHLEDDYTALRRAKALLKPGGHLIATVPAFMFMWAKHDDISMHKRRYVRFQLRNLFQETGFALDKLTYFNSYLFPLALARRVGRRVLNNDDGREFDLPPEWLNESLRSVFAAEEKALLNAGTQGGFPFGLSLLAVAHPE